MKRAILNWSGGKDSSLTLHALKKSNDYDICHLLTNVNEAYQRVSMHGVRIDLLKDQAKSLGINFHPLFVPKELPSMEVYDKLMGEALKNFKNDGIDYSIYGDIFLEDLKEYRENQLSKVGMKGVFPIWKKETSTLAHEFVELGFKAIVVCVNEKRLDRSFVGRELDQNFLNDLPGTVDPCGENGEFHSFVYDGPIFSFPIKMKRGKIVSREFNGCCGSHSGNSCSTSPEKQIVKFWYCDIIPLTEKVT